jgi:hypothetical protein
MRDGSMAAEGTELHVGVSATAWSPSVRVGRAGITNAASYGVAAGLISTATAPCRVRVREGNKCGLACSASHTSGKQH